MWLSGRIGKAYRLPSEAEWEYATRATTTPSQQPRYYFGNNALDLCKYANGADESSSFSWKNHCKDGFPYTSPVGSFQPNGFGLYDMLGNVWNWTEDCWNDTYNGGPADTSAWTRGDCSRRVVRGGSWDDSPVNLRSAYRAMGPSADGRGSSYGFRVARML
jgi:formylglycine-generating enzyme required for sulfatase activity